MKINHNNHNDHSHNSNNSHIYQQVLDKIHKTLESIESDHNLTPDERHAKLVEINDLESKAKDIQNNVRNEHEATQAYEEILDQCSTLSPTSHNLGSAPSVYHAVTDKLNNRLAYWQNPRPEATPYQRSLALHMIKQMQSWVNAVHASSSYDESQKLKQYYSIENDLTCLTPNDADEDVDCDFLIYYAPKKSFDEHQVISYPDRMKISKKRQSIATNYNQLYDYARYVAENLRQGSSKQPQYLYRYKLSQRMLSNMLKTLPKIISGPDSNASINRYLNKCTGLVNNLKWAFGFMPDSDPSGTSLSSGIYNDSVGMIQNFKSNILDNSSLNHKEKQTLLDKLDKKITELNNVQLSNVADSDKQNEYKKILGEAQSIYEKTI